MEVVEKMGVGGWNWGWEWCGWMKGWMEVGMEMDRWMEMKRVDGVRVHGRGWEMEEMVSGEDGFFLIEDRRGRSDWKTHFNVSSYFELNIEF